MIFYPHASLWHTGHRQQIPEILPYLAVNGTQSSTSPPTALEFIQNHFFFGKTHIPKQFPLAQTQKTIFFIFSVVSLYSNSQKSSLLSCEPITPELIERLNSMTRLDCFLGNPLIEKRVRKERTEMELLKLLEMCTVHNHKQQNNLKR